MLFSLVIVVFTLAYFKGTESTFLELEKQCVPTATLQGPCHVCVCTTEGVYHCRPQKCQSEDARKSRPTTDCEPNFVFRQDNTFCRCNNDGFWLSENCEELFGYLYPRVNVLHQHIKTNILCIANTLYLIDCNICRCSEDGVFDVKLCTNRYCSQGYKADSCSYGDILRTENQLCSCSDINYYIDRLCIKISDDAVQIVQITDVLQLEDIGSSLRRLSDIQSKICDSTIFYTDDCNQCVCDRLARHLVCTKNPCKRTRKVSLRQETINEIESLSELKSDVGIPCEPGTRYRYKCNVCTCTKDGSPYCTTMVCLQNVVLDIKSLRGLLSMANVTRENVKLPEIRHGDKCIYGMKYKMNCNTCYCGHKNNLLCTKAACLHALPPEIPGQPQFNKRTKFDNTVENKNRAKKRERKVIKKIREEPLRTKTAGFPALPSSKNCLPGRIYQTGCQRCFCMTNKKPICSTENACNQSKATRDLRPVDVRPKIKETEFKNLPSLVHAASPCTPGTTYKVDCNTCVCDEFQNLLCDKLLCVSFADMHRAEANKKSGLPCNSSNFLENFEIQSECVKCRCNGTTYCQAQEGCEVESEKIMRTHGFGRNGTGFALDYTAEKCLPEHIYKDNCNRCYCQEDQSLRCTQKTCLNYNQARKLEEQQKYLQEHGL